ncbi:MAG: tetratricopeptide repeat protein [Pyrinomonadaceae bacterium]
MQTENQMRKWLDGQISLGAAADWDKDEIRIISEIAYSLAQQGRNREAIVMFEGLIAVAPATAYFQAALGALHLRLKDFPRAIEYLDAALEIEPNDIVSLVNRGEARMRIEKPDDARADFARAVELSAANGNRQVDVNDEITLAAKRARALLSVIKT